jgi:hypothetical protein
MPKQIAQAVRNVRDVSRSLIELLLRDAVGVQVFDQRILHPSPAAAGEGTL